MNAIEPIPVTEQEIDDVIELIKNKCATFSINDQRVDRVVRKLIGDGLTASEVCLRLRGAASSRNAVIGYCHRAKPPIPFCSKPGWHVIAENKRLARERKKERERVLNPTLSTHEVRLRASMYVVTPHPGDRRYFFACPECGAEPTFACFTMKDRRKIGTPRPHRQRRELNLKANLPVEKPEVITATPVIRRFVAKCTWHGCNNDPMMAGKPYCREHHEQSGALMPVLNVYTGSQYR